MRLSLTHPTGLNYSSQITWGISGLTTITFGRLCLACSFCAFLGGQGSCRIREFIWVKAALTKAFGQHDRKKCMNEKWENPIKMNMLGTAHRPFSI
jgi:hypothetical protein